MYRDRRKLAKSAARSLHKIHKGVSFYLMREWNGERKSWERNAPEGRRRRERVRKSRKSFHPKDLSCRSTCQQRSGFVSTLLFLLGVSLFSMEEQREEKWWWWRWWLNIPTLVSSPTGFPVLRRTRKDRRLLGRQCSSSYVTTAQFHRMVRRVSIEFDSQMSFFFRGKTLESHFPVVKWIRMGLNT